MVLYGGGDANNELRIMIAVPIKICQISAGILKQVKSILIRKKFASLTTDDAFNLGANFLRNYVAHFCVIPVKCYSKYAVPIYFNSNRIPEKPGTFLMLMIIRMVIFWVSFLRNYQEYFCYIFVN